MDFFDVVEKRRSIRAFSEQPVAEATLGRILQAANRAPSAGNLQAFEIYVVSANAEKAKLARAAGDQMFLTEAPAVLVFAANPYRSSGKYGRRGERLYAVQDATIACCFAMLAATALGLASVWVGAFDEDEVRRVIQAPTDVRPVAMLPLGHGAEKPPLRERRALDDIVHHV